MSVTVRAKLPKADTNGLAQMESSIVENPDNDILVIAYVRPDTIESHLRDDDHPRVVKTTLVHVEPVAPTDKAKIEKILRSTYHARTGKATLPFEDEDGGE